MIIPKTVDYSIYEEPLYWDNKETDTPGYGEWEHWPEIAALFESVLGIETLLAVIKKVLDNPRLPSDEAE